MRKLPLLLLAGLACDARVWREVVPALASRDDILRFSFQGFSTLARMAAHVLAHAPAEFIVAGHSMGGRVALMMAAMAPQRLRGMALLSTGIHPAGPAEPAHRQRLVAIARTQGMAALASEWLPPMFDPGRPPAPALMADLAAMVAAQPVESFAGQISALLERPDMAPALAAFPRPVLLLCGAGDGWSPPADHAEMLAITRHGQLQIVADAGHFLPLEQPEAVAAALSGWLAGL